MFVLKYKIESIFLILISAATGLLLIVNINKPQLKIASSRSIIHENIIPTPLPAETPISNESPVFEISSDGSKKVILKTAENKDETRSVTLFTQDDGGYNTNLILSKSLKKDENMEIPYNTWSPDNKYFFIRENTSAGTNIMVFNAKGEPFPDGEVYIDLTGLFMDFQKEDIFKEATGWGAENLIIVNTTKTDSSPGPSYWFEVPSKAIIRLSTVF